MSGKHAYLIMAHEEPVLLRTLLDLLDDERNDIYLQVDGRSSLDPLDFAVARAGIVRLPPMPIYWAGFSQIEAEMRLLESSTRDGYYQYYHLITGTDLPLMTQDKIHSMLDRSANTNFLTYQPENDAHAYWKVAYWHPWVENDRYRTSRSLKSLSHAAVRAQMAVGYTRLPADAPDLKAGSAYFSITHEFAIYLVAQRKRIERLFQGSIAADEVFVTTLLSERGSEFALSAPRPSGPGNLRHIDWDRRKGNSPHTFRWSDLEELRGASRSAAFARKFSMRVDSRIVKHIAESLRTRGEL